MILPPRYRNYWLDLKRKQEEDNEKERQKAISGIAGILQAIANGKKPKMANLKKP